MREVSMCQPVSVCIRHACIHTNAHPNDLSIYTKIRAVLRKVLLEQQRQITVTCTCFKVDVDGLTPHRPVNHA